ncbi:transcription elongation factor B polypeptide 3-like [Pelobates fuscus]|uniref:transcription elongation factor B polypeptide 3-like n=1 Tax=Pelobates fuscus TaxID=191477 RepID=UPI002FE4B6DF
MDINTVELELKDTCQELSTSLEGYGKLQRFLKGGEYYMFKHSTMFECTFVQVLENGCGVSISCPTPVLILAIASIDPTLPAEVLFIAELLVNEDPICAKLEPMKLTRLYPLRLVSITVIDAESGRLKITFVTGSSFYLEPYDNESREAVQFKTFLIDWLKTKQKKHLEETSIISFQNKVNENEQDENRLNTENVNSYDNGELNRGGSLESGKDLNREKKSKLGAVKNVFTSKRAEKNKASNEIKEEISGISFQNKAKETEEEVNNRLEENTENINSYDNGQLNRGSSLEMAQDLNKEKKSKFHLIKNVFTSKRLEKSRASNEIKGTKLVKKTSQSKSSLKE